MERFDGAPADGRFECDRCQRPPQSSWRRLLPNHAPQHCLICHATFRGIHCRQCHRTFSNIQSLKAHLVGQFLQPPDLASPVSVGLGAPVCLDPKTMRLLEGPRTGEACYRSPETNKWGIDVYLLAGDQRPDDGPTHCPQCYATAWSHCVSCHLSFHCDECFEAHRGKGETGTVCFAPDALAAMPWLDRQRRGVRGLHGPRVNDWGTTYYIVRPHSHYFDD